MNHILMAISSGELSSVMLIVGALVALAIAVFGRKGLKEGKKDTEFNKKLRIVSGISRGRHDRMGLPDDL